MNRGNQDNMDREDREREERIRKLREEQERLKQIEKEQVRNMPKKIGPVQVHAYILVMDRVYSIPGFRVMEVPWRNGFKPS